MSQLESIKRRRFLKQSGQFLGMAAFAGFPALGAHAEQKTITALMLGVLLPDSLRPFVEKPTNVKVNNLPFISQTDFLAKLTAPGGTSRYDYMVVLTDYIQGPLLGAHEGDELARPLDLSKIPNAAQQLAMFKGHTIQRDGKTYGVPIFGGYDSVIYNRKKIPENDELTQSWNVLFSDKYAGRVAVRDDANQTINAAALALGHESPWTMDKADVDQVTKFLIAKKKNFRTMWTQFGEAVNLLSSGEVDAMYGWIPMRAALQRQGVDATNNWPKEGLPWWTQCGIIPKNAPNWTEALAVLNAMCGPEYGAALARSTEYIVANSAAIAKFSAAERQKYGYDTSDRGLRLVPLAWPKIMDYWIEAWGRVKAA